MKAKYCSNGNRFSVQLVFLQVKKKSHQTENLFGENMKHFYKNTLICIKIEISDKFLLLEEKKKGGGFIKYKITSIQSPCCVIAYTAKY